MKTYYVLNITKLHVYYSVIDIVHHNALEKWRIQTAQSLSVLYLQSHGW